MITSGPTSSTGVMPDATSDNAVVALVDWNGRVIWFSSERPSRPSGKSVADYVRVDYRERAEEAIRRVVRERETLHLYLVNDLEEHYCVWLWPLESKEVAVCVLANRVPPEAGRLSDRERECLELLAKGLPAAAIAEQLGIANSTVHTHFRRAREKLNLPTLEALISFASRYCTMPPCPDLDDVVSAK